MAEQTTSIVREAPEIEAYKLGLLQSAKQLVDAGQTIPPYMVSEMSGLQIKGTRGSGYWWLSALFRRSWLHDG